MTASITHCCKSALERFAPWRWGSAWLLAIALAVPALPVQAGSIAPVSASLSPADDAAYQLNAEFDIDLGGRIEEAVSRGVPIYFNLEFELTRPRWYWISEHVAGTAITHRLSYNALTRQYRLSTGALYQNFATFAEAVRVLSRVLILHAVDRTAVKRGESYVAAVRLSLDKTQLPKPFQVDAITNSDWQVDTKALRWQFVPADKMATVDG